MGPVDELEHKEDRGGLPSFVPQRSHQEKVQTLNPAAPEGKSNSESDLELETGLIPNTSQYTQWQFDLVNGGGHA